MLYQWFCAFLLLGTILINPTVVSAGLLNPEELSDSLNIKVKTPIIEAEISVEGVEAKTPVAEPEVPPEGEKESTPVTETEILPKAVDVKTLAAEEEVSPESVKKSTSVVEDVETTAVEADVSPVVMKTEQPVAEVDTLSEGVEKKSVATSEEDNKSPSEKVVPTAAEEAEVTSAEEKEPITDVNYTTKSEEDSVNSIENKITNSEPEEKLRLKKILLNKSHKEMDEQEEKVHKQLKNGPRMSPNQYKEVTSRTMIPEGKLPLNRKLGCSKTIKIKINLGFPGMLKTMDSLINNEIIVCFINQKPIYEKTSYYFNQWENAPPVLPPKHNFFF